MGQFRLSLLLNPAYELQFSLAASGTGRRDPYCAFAAAMSASLRTANTAILLERA